MYQQNYSQQNDGGPPFSSAGYAGGYGSTQQNPAAYQAAVMQGLKNSDAQARYGGYNDGTAQGDNTVSGSRRHSDGLPPVGGWGAGSHKDDEERWYPHGTPLHSDLPVSIRHGFIRKVYGILTVQLAITTAIGAAFLLSPGAKVWIASNPWIFWVALVATFGSLFTFVCCGQAARKFPFNYLLLFTFTCAEGVLVGISSVRFSAVAIGLAVGITAAVVLSCTIFAIQTKWDFTKMGGYLFGAAMSLLLFGIIAMFFPGIPILQKVYAGIGCLIFSLYLIHDTQMIVGGKHRSWQFGVDDYCFAALALYIDIINIFMFVLSLVGGGGSND